MNFVTSVLAYRESGITSRCSALCLRGISFHSVDYYFIENLLTPDYSSTSRTKPGRGVRDRTQFARLGEAYLGGESTQYFQISDFLENPPSYFFFFEPYFDRP